MKKHIILFFCLLGCYIFPLYAQVSDNNHFTFQFIRKNSKFFGYYLPLDFVETFERSRDWFSTREYIDDRQYYNEDGEYIEEKDYIYIRIDEEGIWVQGPIVGDGFSEKLIDDRNGIENYRYEIINDEIIIFKDNGKKYKKISNSFEYDIPVIDNYIGRIVLKDFILSGEVILENNIITIPALNFGKFRIETWGDFSEYYASLYVYGFDMGWWLDMDIEGDKITIYTYETWIFGKRTGKKIYWTNKK